MLDLQVVTMFGLDRDPLLLAVSIAGGIVVAITVIAMLWVSVAPAYSQKWNDALGASGDEAPSPADEIPGFDEPVTPGESHVETLDDEAEPTGAAGDDPADEPDGETATN